MSSSHATDFQENLNSSDQQDQIDQINTTAEVTIDPIMSETENETLESDLAIFQGEVEPLQSTTNETNGIILREEFVDVLFDDNAANATESSDPTTLPITPTATTTTTTTPVLCDTSPDTTIITTSSSAAATTVTEPASTVE